MTDLKETIRRYGKQQQHLHRITLRAAAAAHLTPSNTVLPRDTWDLLLKAERDLHNHLVNLYLEHHLPIAELASSPYTPPVPDHNFYPFSP